jgi:hypothetical protein
MIALCGLFALNLRSIFESTFVPGDRPLCPANPIWDFGNTSVSLAGALSFGSAIARSWARSCQARPMLAFLPLLNLYF